MAGKIWYIKYRHNCLAEGHVGGQLSFLNPWFKSGRPELTKNLITNNDLVLSAQVWLLAGNCPKEVWAHIHTQSSWLPRLPDYLLLNSQDGYEISFWWLNISSEFGTASCAWMMLRKSALAAFPLWHFPLEEDLPWRLQKTQKHLLLPACCCMAVSWHGGGKGAVLLQDLLSVSQLPAPFQSSSNIINPPAFLHITKTTTAMHSYGCCRILFPRSYFHFCRNICILSQNFPRLLYAWGKILFCLFEGLIKCCTARGLEQGDKRKRMWLFFMAKIVETLFELSL